MPVTSLRCPSCKTWRHVVHDGPMPAPAPCSRCTGQLQSLVDRMRRGLRARLHPMRKERLMKLLATSVDAGVPFVKVGYGDAEGGLT